MSSAKLRASLLQVNSLVHAVQSFPESMPKRWVLLSQLVSLAKEWESGSTAETVYINIGSIYPQKVLQLCIQQTKITNLQYGVWLVCWSGCGSV